jgi:LmbE family N-acetylglucosaminyl deacetylase
LITLLSPHLDDAVLSCGALIAGCTELGLSVVVVTVFNGPPDGPLSQAAMEFHARCGHSDDAMKEREAEDDLALRRLGAASQRLSLPEALYRRESSGLHRYPNHADINQGNVADEADLVATLAERLAGLSVVREADLLISPLGIGHIDHELVAAASSLLVRPGGSMLWYEETPYILYDWCADWEAKISPSGPTVCKVTSQSWQAKLDAIACYASQEQIIWPDPSSWRQQLTAYAAALGDGIPAERYWQRSAGFRCLRKLEGSSRVSNLDVD